MAQQFEHRSVFREIDTSGEYRDCAEFLAPYGADGWELVFVCWVSAVYDAAEYEVFYLKRAAPGAP